MLVYHGVKVRGDLGRAFSFTDNISRLGTMNIENTYTLSACGVYATWLPFLPNYFLSAMTSCFPAMNVDAGGNCAPTGCPTLC